MVLDVTCPCGKRLRVKSNLAGKRIKCPACGQAVVVSAPGSETTSSANNATKVDKVAVRCRCGAKFALESAPGVQVKCPQCGQRVRTSVSTQASPKPVGRPSDPMADLLDEIGFKAARSRNTCPNCKVGLPPDAILCVQCGYHLEKGKALTTKRLGRR